MIVLSMMNKTRPPGRVFSSAHIATGFTIIELIVTIVILAIIAVVAGSKFFGTSKFQEMGFADAVANGLRYAHKMAIATGCDTRAQITASNITLFQRATNCTTGNFTRNVSKPGGNIWIETVPGGLSVSSLDIYFDNKGKPFFTSSAAEVSGVQSVTVGSRTISVEPETGFVRQ